MRCRAQASRRARNGVGGEKSWQPAGAGDAIYKYTDMGRGEGGACQ